MAESQELTLKGKRESAAKKALEGGKGETDPNSDLLIPGTSVTNEEAMRDPDNMPGKVEVLADEVEVASSLIGGETPLEAHKTALDTRDEADRFDTEKEADRYWAGSEEVNRAFGRLDDISGASSHRSPRDIGLEMIRMEEEGFLTLSPKFKTQVLKAIEAWDEAVRADRNIVRPPASVQADRDAYEASRKASDIESLLGKE